LRELVELRADVVDVAAFARPDGANDDDISTATPKWLDPRVPRLRLARSHVTGPTL